MRVRIRKKKTKQKKSKTEILEAELKKVSELKKIAAKGTSDLGKQNTVVRNLFKDLVNSANVSLDTYFVLDEVKYNMGYAVTEIIDVEKWMDLYEKGEITKEQFTTALSVNKSKAKLAIGEGMVNAISITNTSTDLTLRTAPLKGAENEVVLINNKPVKSRSKPVRKTRVARHNLLRERYENDIGKRNKIGRRNYTKL